MSTMNTLKILKIFISENDRLQGEPLYLALLNRVKEAGLAGGTAIRGIAGYAAGEHIHQTKPLQQTDNRPVIVEIIDEEAQLIAALPLLTPMVQTGLIVMEDVRLISYQHPACEPGTEGPAACSLSSPEDK